MGESTIAAISTPLGEGGIGIVRISGSEAVAIADKVFRGREKIADLSSHVIRYGKIVDPVTEEIIDEALVSLMRAPRTFTREDVVEINCHGGIVAVKAVLEAVVKAGAELAEPGEFTKRAFLNGRIDLAQAEAVIDVIRAQTERGLRVALKHLGGDLSKRIQELMASLLEIAAHLEVSIDFPDEDIEEMSPAEMIARLQASLDHLERLLASSERGRVLREGINTVILGKPNVGKSSLLNALLQENRAIVTNIPGTTRDVIEEVINIRGIPLRIMDTAGIRETEDVVERLGVEKTRQLLSEADLVLVVLDQSKHLEPEDEEAISLSAGKQRIFVLNKSDLGEAPDFSLLRKQYYDIPMISISAFTGENLEALEKEIEEMFFAGGMEISGAPLVTNMRHRLALERALNSLRSAKSALEGGLPPDLVAVDVYDAYKALGEITGDTIEEDVIDKIFATFCLGK